MAPAVALLRALSETREEKTKLEQYQADLDDWVLMFLQSDPTFTLVCREVAQQEAQRQEQRSRAEERQREEQRQQEQERQRNASLAKKKAQNKSRYRNKW